VDNWQGIFDRNMHFARALKETLTQPLAWPYPVFIHH